MRKLLILVTFIIVAMVGHAQNRSTTVATGSTLNSTITFAAVDSIKANDTYWIYVKCEQDYPQMQNVAITMDELSGNAAVSLSLYGKTFTSDSWHRITCTQVGADTIFSADGTKYLTNATSTRYRYFKVQLKADATTQKSKVTGFQFKTWFTGGLVTSASVSDGTATLSSGALSGATTGVFSGLISANGGVISTGYNFASATVVNGTGDAITMNFTPDLPSLAVGLAVTFVAEAANTGAVTLAIDGGASKAIGEYNGAYSALDANDIRSGQLVTIVYDGTQWVMMSPSGN